MSRSTRRELLGVGAATAFACVSCRTVVAVLPKAAAEALPPPGPDAPLVALCAQFMALQIRVDAANAGTGDVSEEELTEAVSRQALILDEAGGLPATTLAGHRARALMLERYYLRSPEGEFESEVGWHRIGPLFRDLLGIPL